MDDQLQIQDTFNEDDIRNLVEEGVIENVQGENSSADEPEPSVQ